MDENNLVLKISSRECNYNICYKQKCQAAHPFGGGGDKLF